MASLQSYLYILNHLDSILDNFPICIYHLLLYSKNDVSTKHTFFSVYWTVHVAL